MKLSIEEKQMYSQNNEFPPALTNRIVCGDSVLGLHAVPDSSVDLIILPLQFEKTDKDLDGYIARIMQILDECMRIVKYGGRIAVVANTMLNIHLPVNYIVSDYLLHNGMIWYSDIVWDRKTTACNPYKFGSYMLPSAPYINPDWSTINIFSKGTIRHIGDPADADMTEEEYRSAIGGMWHVVNNQNSRALIPETVAYRLIKLLTYRGDVVVAPYNKIGKVTLAAAKTGRRYLGIDAFDAYCDTANDLIAKIR